MMNTTATVQTVKARRYMKALINHFGRKVSAEYTDDNGYVEFGFGRCDIYADDNRLTFKASSNDGKNIPSLQRMIDSHLARFTQGAIPTLTWVEN